jgi:tripartite-type tricarboxylate transporter receptor subunit TctC
MKKVLSIVSLVLVFMMLVACGGGTTQSQAPASQAPASQAPASQAPASQAPASEAPKTDWPTKPVTLIVPAGAGGDTDLNCRVFAKYWQDEIGQTVVVQNIKGMAVAFDEIANAANDGYTAGVYHPSFFVANTLGTTDKHWFDSYEFVNVYANDKQTAWMVSAKSEFKTLTT